MLTMAIGGLWHGGDNWNYLIWGIIHGSALCCDRAFTQRGWSMPNFASRSLTLLAVMFAWTIFRAAGFDNALDMWAGQLGLNGMSIGDEIILALRPGILLTFVIGLICVVYPATRIAKQGGLGIMSWSMVWPVLTFAYAVIVLAGQKAIPFLYFQF
jgi:alginate O-acetyltransferase complex protein AlgI